MLKEVLKKHFKHIDRNRNEIELEVLVCVSDVFYKNKNHASDGELFARFGHAVDINGKRIKVGKRKKKQIAKEALATVKSGLEQMLAEQYDYQQENGSHYV